MNCKHLNPINPCSPRIPDMPRDEPVRYFCSCVSPLRGLGDSHVRRYCFKGLGAYENCPLYKADKNPHSRPNTNLLPETTENKKHWWKFW
ncbi:hypothetical protein [Methanosarcina sp. UBA5]|uniref:hypothetical protein n=1 Tax=Methanosarcina sp. UBA5 TaxID=1915593 RepID=UPI0025E5AC57|nr:hypothetical protein [Methanosarcina sp. UBA5]